MTRFRPGVSFSRAELDSSCWKPFSLLLGVGAVALLLIAFPGVAQARCETPKKLSRFRAQRLVSRRVPPNERQAAVTTRLD
jgi:hypothetical protein